MCYRIFQLLIYKHLNVCCFIAAPYKTLDILCAVSSLNEIDFFSCAIIRLFTSCLHGALESVAVLWRLTSYLDIIIIIIIKKQNRL